MGCLEVGVLDLSIFIHRQMLKKKTSLLHTHDTQLPVTRSSTRLLSAIWLVIHARLPEPITLYSLALCVFTQSRFPLYCLAVQMQISFNRAHFHFPLWARWIVGFKRRKKSLHLHPFIYSLVRANDTLALFFFNTNTDSDNFTFILRPCREIVSWSMRCPHTGVAGSCF